MLAGRYDGQDAGPVPTSSSGAAGGWAYDPNSTAADFISNSAILTATLPRSVLTVAPNSGPGREKWLTLRQSPPFAAMCSPHYYQGQTRINRFASG